MEGCGASVDSKWMVAVLIYSYINLISLHILIIVDSVEGYSANSGIKEWEKRYI